MKTLTIRQPWASLIALGIKSQETRSWSTNYRGELAIHASARMGKAEKDICLQKPFFAPLRDAGLILMERYVLNSFIYDFPLGAVIATCNLVDCLLIEEDGLYHEFKTQFVGQAINTLERVAPLPSEPELSFGDYTSGRYAWLLSDVRQVEPVRCKGMLGLWNLPEEIEEMIKVDHGNA